MTELGFRCPQGRLQAPHAGQGARGPSVSFTLVKFKYECLKVALKGSNDLKQNE